MAILATINQVNGVSIAWEESNYHGASIRPDAHSATRHAQINGGLFKEFAQAMCGWSVYDSTNHVFNRFLPEPHPTYDWMVVREVEFVRELAVPTDGGPLGSIKYDTIECAVNYEAVPGVQYLEDFVKPAGMTHEGWRYLMFDEQFALAARIIPRGQLVLTANPGPGTVILPEPGVAMEATSTWTIKFLQVPAVVNSSGVPTLPGSLEANINSVVGHVNNATFLGRPPRTLFCCAPKRELKMMSNGLLCFDLTFTLEVRGNSDTTGIANGTGSELMAWDRMRFTDGLFYRVYRKDQAQTVSIYREATFTDLFKLT
ncbi:MAG: hypothetical protein RLZZ373_321 [Pseudomonadota bacterium]|jgi:hypothetical protein